MAKGDIKGARDGKNEGKEVGTTKRKEKQRRWEYGKRERGVRKGRGMKVRRER